MVLFWYNQIYKPGSVLTAIYLALWLPIGSSRLLGTAGSALCPSTALLRDRVYIVLGVLYLQSTQPMLPWAGWALTPPFQPYLAAVYFCCTCPRVTPGRRYLLSLPCGARTFLTCSFSACSRGCPTWLPKYCNLIPAKCQRRRQTRLEFSHSQVLSVINPRYVNREPK